MRRKKQPNHILEWSKMILRADSQQPQVGLL